MNEVLKPCPFCGREGRIIYVYGLFVPYCKNESCILYNLDTCYNTREKAIEEWNKRIEKSQGDQEHETL